MVIKSTLPVSLFSLLNQHPAFANLLASAVTTPPVSDETNTHTLLQQLPANLQDKVQVQDIGGRILLVAPNNAVAQILRFHLPRLKQALANKPVSITLRPSLASPAPPAAQHAITPATAGLLRDIAQDCEHPPLAAALQRLAALAK